MRFWYSAARIETSRDIGESMPASTKRCGAFIAQGSGIQTGLVKTNREVLYMKITMSLISNILIILIIN